MLFDKRQVISLHESEFEKWEKLLANLSTAQITNPLPPDGLSAKDTVAHLGAWLERTIARLKAALDGHEPDFPHMTVITPNTVYGW